MPQWLSGWRSLPGRGHPDKNKWRRDSAFKQFLYDLADFFNSGGRYLGRYLSQNISRFEFYKSWLAVKLYQQRGRWSRPFSHIGMGGLTIIGLVLAPILASEYNNFFGDQLESGNFISPNTVLAFSGQIETSTVTTDVRDRVIPYVVQSGDTVSQIAEKFGISTDTIRWQNDLKSVNDIKPGQTLEILPVTGILHKVRKGETVYSIAEKYEANPQAIVDFPFNSFTNDETFALAIGQELVVPDGVMPQQQLWSPRSYVAQRTPDAGVVTAAGQFVWPAGGTLTQRYAWYHKGIDIANRSAPGIVAADSGTVAIAGWPDNSGYGNRVIIDHGNGFQTLYAHLSKTYVQPGQTVNRGDLIGQMGSTGRSTGVHLHFEIRSSGGAQNPLGYLK
jgi:murein DD-endopeptidase MepM/ murein hydrolase activator NlpD